MRTVLESLRSPKDKAMPKNANDILICCFQWVSVENRERRVIYGEKQNINAGNLTDFDDIMYSGNAVDGLITTDIDAVHLTDCADDAAGGLISHTNDSDSTYCAYH